MELSSDEQDLTVFENLMHEFDTARQGIRTTISAVNRATNGPRADMPSLKAHAAHLVDQLDMLDVLFEFLKIELNPELIKKGGKAEINIHGIFYRAVKHYSARLKEKSLGFKIEDVQGFVLRTSTSLAILPLILMDNAVKYAPKGGHLTIGLDQLERRITIESKGTEVMKDEISQIFDRGFRGKYAIRTDSGGQGLGLFIAKRICDVLGCTIGVKQTATAIEFGGIPYTTVRFQISLPRHITNQ